MIKSLQLRLELRDEHAHEERPLIEWWDGRVERTSATEFVSFLQINRNRLTPDSLCGIICSTDDRGET